VWSQGVFTPSAYPVDDLVSELNVSDFGVFVFSADDVITMRREEKRAIRDNVVFELGLFVGRLGRSRNFMIRPNDADDLHIPSDLAGLSPLTFDANRRDENIVAALGAACNKIRSAIQKMGVITATIDQVVADLDEKCVQLMAMVGPNEYFSAPPSGTQYGSFTSQAFDHAVQRLLGLKVLRFDLSPDAKHYAYHWTDLGKLVLAKYGFDKGEAVSSASVVKETVDPTDFGLSKEAIQLLSESVDDKQGTIMMVGTLQGLIIQTNGHNFTEGGDRRVEAIWKGAVEELYSLELLEDRAGKHEVFQVTAKGYKVADTVKPKE
jgi:CAP12/Pycsar effector protein, TIR domain